jgi:pimeloyl-ACP methyl ester carboxylesterase
MADDAIELLDHLEWMQDINLVGISMGGMISLEVADQIPERLASLTLTSTTARRNIPTVSGATICLIVWNNHSNFYISGQP